MRTANNNNAIVIAMNKEEVEMKTKDQIRVMLETVGVEMSNTVFKKTKKAELVAMLEKYLDPSKKVEIVVEEVPNKYPINPLDDPEVQDMDVSDEALLPAIETPVVEEKVEEEDDKWIPLMTAIKTAMMKQTLERNYQKLFFKDDDGNYISVIRHFYGMVAACIKQLYPNTVEKNGRVPQRYLDQTVDEIIKEGLVWSYDHPKYHKVLMSDAKTLNGIYKEVYPTK